MVTREGGGGAQEGNMKYFGHTYGESQENWQLLKDHLQNTADLAYKFGEDSELADFGFLAGLLHDIGKYSIAFQKKLFGSSEHVDHSTAGGKEVVKLSQGDRLQAIIGQLIAYCIVGHHSGLPDFGSPIDLESEGTFNSRLKKIVNDYSMYKYEIDISKISIPKIKPLKPSTKSGGFTLSFFTRMLYSCLVDADFQETENFMTKGLNERGGYKNISRYNDEFNQYLSAFANPKNPIDQKRNEILKECITKAKSKQGFFTLTVPTGGGKTIASMAFALNHAKQNQLSRIIYIIPFTSIIEQNAEIFKQALGRDSVLEHHSNFDWQNRNQPKLNQMIDDKTNSSLEKLKLSAENWDIPIIVTTNVQFFESLFSNRSRGCRKIHNISKSVLIFDEAQMLPMDYLKPCLFAVNELVKNYGSSAIFCTATQPSIEGFIPGKPKFQELAPDPLDLYKFFKRVQVRTL